MTMKGTEPCPIELREGFDSVELFNRIDKAWETPSDSRNLGLLVTERSGRRRTVELTRIGRVLAGSEAKKDQDMPKNVERRRALDSSLKRKN
jgi:hypothetical protein